MRSEYSAGCQQHYPQRRGICCNGRPGIKAVAIACKKVVGIPAVNVDIVERDANRRENTCQSLRIKRRLDKELSNCYEDDKKESAGSKQSEFVGVLLHSAC